MSDIETIYHGEVLIGTILRASYAPARTEFVTKDDESLQIGLIVYGQGTAIQPHVHNPVERQVQGTSEVIVVRQGLCMVDFYTSAKAYLCSYQLQQGDIVSLLPSGGHGFRMMEDTILFEVKQGPYVGERDKERFDQPQLETP